LTAPGDLDDCPAVRIYTLWESEGVVDGELPWLLIAAESAEGGELPKEYVEARRSPTVREMVIAIPDGDVMRLFQPPVVRGHVER
jgi:hypothetical protein